MSQRSLGDDRWTWKRDEKGHEYRIDEKTNQRIYRQTPRIIPTVVPGNLQSAASGSAYYGSTKGVGTIQPSTSPPTSSLYTYGTSPNYPSADVLSRSFNQMSLGGSGNGRGNVPFGSNVPGRQSVAGQSGPSSATSLPRAQQPTTSAGTNRGEASNEAGMRIVASLEQQKTLDEDYQLRKHPSKYFQVGKIFLTVHTEAHGESRRPQQRLATAETYNPDVFVVAYGTLVYSKVRRFVVVRESTDSCSALAISTHSGRGAGRNNGPDHGIIYTGLQPPKAYEYEKGILPTAIRVDPLNPADKLHPSSRLNYAKLYTIEHNVKVKPFGIVNNRFMHILMNQFTLVFFRESTTSMATAISQPTRQNLQALGFNDAQMDVIIRMITGRRANVQTAISSVAWQSALQSFAGEDRQQELAQHVVSLTRAGMTLPQAIAHVKLVKKRETPASIDNDKAADEDDDDVDDDGDDGNDESDGNEEDEDEDK